MYYTPDFMAFEEITKANMEWLHSEQRQAVFDKMNLLGIVEEYSGDLGSGMLQRYNGHDKNIVLPDIFLFANGILKNRYEEHFESIKLNSHMRGLGSNALHNNSLHKIELNDGLEYIYSEALAWNTLSEIVIPSSLKLIGKNALSNSLIEYAEVTVLSEEIEFEDIIEAIGETSAKNLIILFKKHRKRDLDRQYDNLITQEFEKSAEGEKNKLNLIQGMQLDWV